MQKKFSLNLNDPRILFAGTLALAVLGQTQGYCDVDGSSIDIDTTTNSIKNILFGSAVRKAALTLGLGAGLFQAFMSGSIRPLLVYGGLGLAVCYLPKVVDWISSVNV